MFVGGMFVFVWLPSRLYSSSWVELHLLYSTKYQQYNNTLWLVHMHSISIRTHTHTHTWSLLNYTQVASHYISPTSLATIQNYNTA